MLFQKEKDYGNTITKIGRKKNKKNETAKKKGNALLKTESWLPRWSEESQIYF